MLQWKQRLYSWLLKRVLGPWLDAESLRQLHRSIEVSFQEGKFALTDVGLNVEYLSSKLVQQQRQQRKRTNDNNENKHEEVPSASSCLRIRNARVKRLEILLSLVEHDGTEDDDTATTSTLAWRAVQLGTSSGSSPTVCLVAKIEVDGVVLEVEPRCYRPPPPSCREEEAATPPPPQITHKRNFDDEATATDTDPATTTATAKTMLESYIDAAMASLRLSVQLSNFTVRLYDSFDDFNDDDDDNSLDDRRTTATADTDAGSLFRRPSSRKCWIQLGLESASYCDNTSSSNILAEEDGTETTNDTTANNNNNNNTNRKRQKILFDKSFELSKITLRTGETYCERREGLDDDDGEPSTAAAADSATAVSSTMALLDGNSHITIRATEYQLSNNSHGMDCIPSPSKRQEPNRRSTHIQHDFQINLERLNTSADARTMQRIQSILVSFRRHRAKASAEAAAAAAAASVPATEPSNLNADDDDEADLKTIDGIMKQYYEARVLAQQNHFRNGILLPSDDTENGLNNEPTFDAFFDANDQSFARYSTILRESVLLGNDNKDEAAAATASDTMVHTKLRAHLGEGSFKLAFTSASASPQQVGRSDEYLLLTFADVQTYSSMSLQQSEHSLTIAQLDVEDSQIEQVGQLDGGAVQLRKDGAVIGRRVEIGSVLRFIPPTDDGDNNTMGELLMQPACVSLTVRRERCVGALNDAGEDEDNQPPSSSTQVELQLDPMELTYRRGTMTNLSKFAQSVMVENDNNDESYTLSSQDTAENTKPSGQKISFYASCSSITLTIPILVEKSQDSLYRRCSYSCGDTSWARRSSLSLLLDEVLVESSSDFEEPVFSLACHHIMAYAMSPINGNLMMMERKSRRFDIFCLSGRDEVNPCIPVTIRFWRNSQEMGIPDNASINHGTRTFPKVPAISSFKARQEDDDDDIRIDHVLSSKKVEGFNMISTARKNLRGNDPQGEMLLEASKSDKVIEICIPEVMADCSTEELATLSSMLKNSLSGGATVTAEEGQQMEVNSVHQTALTSRTCIAVECDFVSLGLHGDGDDPNHNTNSSSRSSFSLHLDKLKGHVLRDGSSLRQVRILSHEIDFYELSFPANSIIKKKGYATSSCINVFRQRVSPRASESAVPLFYRSHLFPPISQQSPMLLFDMVDQSTPGLHEPTVRNVHLTAYDMTYRYDPDSRWMEQLMSIVQQMSCSTASDDDNVQQQPSSCSSSQVTRTFLSLADCNIDYSSSPRYKTASRMILRVGDLRLSSNIVWPKPAVQAFSIALGDCVLHLCKNRYAYNWDNSQLPRSALIMHPSTLSLEPLRLPSRPIAETVQKAMSFLTIVTLESLDAVITLTNKNLGLLSEPEIMVNLTIGQLCIFACKDSFQKFISTVSELTADLTALDERALEELRSKSCSVDFEENDPSGNDDDDSLKEKMDSKFHSLEELKQQSAHLSSTLGSDVQPSNHAHDFLLDGYDWTTIDQSESAKCGIPAGEEQAARWYGTSKEAGNPTDDGAEEEFAFLPASFSFTKPLGPNNGPNIISHHFPIVPVSDSLGDGDMGLSKYAGTKYIPPVKSRILVHDLNVRIRFFDGYDWPELLDDGQSRATSKGGFVIADNINVEPLKKDATTEVGKKLLDEECETLKRRAKLMGDLLSNEDTTTGTDDVFQGLPLPQERKKEADLQKLSRRAGKYFQFASSGINVRVDLLEDSSDHRLASCMNISAQDFFVAETVSRDRPIKLCGEWVNAIEHPRDTNDGLLMMKMVTWHPKMRVSPDKEIVNDESEAVIKLLPLRCIIDQKAIRFIRAFFRTSDDGGEPPGEEEGGDEKDKSKNADLPPGLYAVPPPLFRSFRFKSYKLKVDYKPEKLDTKALRDGAFVELINLSPLDGMVLTLDRVEVENEIGFGSVLSLAVREWISDIASTQMYKFLTSTRYLEPIANVSSASADLFVLPWEALRNGESLTRALRAGVQSFSDAVAYEACTTTSRATQFLADRVSKLPAAIGVDRNIGGTALPPRPLQTPRDIIDTAPHVAESLKRGLQTVNYKVIIVPYREYRRRGARGAATSVLKGIPVALAAPTSSTAEAISFALLGARNQFRPDIRIEEESLQRGLHYSGI